MQVETLHTPKKLRRNDLDWLRLLAFGLLIFYHTGMLFVSWGWHIKNPETHSLANYIMLLFNQWRMPLIFLIGGGVIFYSLQKRGSRIFIKERLQRILIPLAFGIIVICVPQAYYEALQKGLTDKSFLEFYLEDYFTRYITWNHLWYLPYVFTYSLLALPLMSWWVNHPKKRIKIEKKLAEPWVLIGLFVPLWCSELLLRPLYPGYQNLVSDWANFVYYLLVFVYGYLICSSPLIMRQLEKNRFWYLSGGVIAYLILYLGVWIPGKSAPPHSALQLFYYGIKTFNTWCWLLFFLGFAAKYLTMGGSKLRYANQAVYPFYILHQTVIIIIGYYIVEWPMGSLMKFLLISFFTFMICWGIYEGVLKKSGRLQLLFGMQYKQKQQRLPELQKS
jgi:glucans biosynthesis protein C